MLHVLNGGQACHTRTGRFRLFSAPIKHILHDGQRGKGVRPTGVESQMRDHLAGLLVCQTIIHRPVEMVSNLGDLAGSNQRTDGHETAVTRRQIGAQPQVSEKDISRVLYESGSNVSEVVLNCGCPLCFGVIIQWKRCRRCGRQLIRADVALRKDILRNGYC